MPFEDQTSIERVEIDRPPKVPQPKTATQKSRQMSQDPREELHKPPKASGRGETSRSTRNVARRWCHVDENDIGLAEAGIEARRSRGVLISTGIDSRKKLLVFNRYER